VKYLLDTNICIYLMKSQPQEVRERFAQCYYGDVGISAVTLAELEYGVEVSSDRAHNAQALEALLEDIVVAPFDSGVARSYGILRAGAPKRQGDALDKLIAAHSCFLEVVLVTNNIKDFQRYPGVKLENWVNQ
jgi:tRNA(fMet)-specific endonuclease VapC